MGFIRLSDDYNDHPKFDWLCDGAFRLWHQGMGFCRKYQTDGLIPINSLRKLKAYSPKRMQKLLTPWQAGANPLWTEMPGRGVQVHDYLEWNLSKAEAQEDRDAAKLRMRRLRGVSSPVRSAEHHTEHSPKFREGKGSDLPIKEKDRAESIEQQAGRFCERFCELYAEHRKGAHYHLKPSLDWSRVCDLLRTWEFVRLEKLAVVLLTSDEEWISRTDRGIGVFAAKASWCDDRLREWEDEHGVTV